MRVEFKNGGKYVDYSLDGGTISFRSGELMLDLAALQKDYPVKITVSEDSAGKLTIGAAKRYVAEIEIPERESVVEKTGVVNPFKFPVIRRVYAPFNADSVALTLWSQ